MKILQIATCLTFVLFTFFPFNAISNENDKELFDLQKEKQKLEQEIRELENSTVDPSEVDQVDSEEFRDNKKLSQRNGVPSPFHFAKNSFGIALSITLVLLSIILGGLLWFLDEQGYINITIYQLPAFIFFGCPIVGVLFASVASGLYPEPANVALAVFVSTIIFSFMVSMIVFIAKDID